MSRRRLVARAAASTRWVRGSGVTESRGIGDGGTGPAVRRGKRPRGARSAAATIRERSAAAPGAAGESLRCSSCYVPRAQNEAEILYLLMHLFKKILPHPRRAPHGSFGTRCVDSTAERFLAPAIGRARVPQEGSSMLKPPLCSVKGSTGEIGSDSPRYTNFSYRPVPWPR